MRLATLTKRSTRFPVSGDEIADEAVDEVSEAGVDEASEESVEDDDSGEKRES